MVVELFAHTVGVVKNGPFHQIIAAQSGLKGRTKVEKYLGFFFNFLKVVGRSQRSKWQLVYATRVAGGRGAHRPPMKNVCVLPWTYGSDQRLLLLRWAVG